MTRLLLEASPELDRDSDVAGVVSDRTAAASLTRPLRVVHVSLTLKTGGLERLLIDFARLHERQRVELEFVAISEVGWIADEIRRRGCPVHQLKPGGRWSRMHQLQRLFAERQIDVVHTHNTYPHLYATPAARWAGVPVVVQTRHGQRMGHGWKSSLQYRLATAFADRVIAVSDDAARLSVTADKLKQSKVARIWNGIDLNDYPYRGPVDKPIAIAVGRLAPEKDLRTLISAMALAAPRVPDLELWIVGGGTEGEALAQQVAHLGLGDRVRLLGERQDVAALLGQAAMYVSSSLSEGLSLTLLEAMAAGLPVVATRVGGTPEVVVEGTTGLLVEPARPDQLAAALVELCRRRHDWRAMGRSGRDRVEAHFNATRMVDDYTQLYEQLYTAKTARRHHTGRTRSGQ